MDQHKKNPDPSGNADSGLKDCTRQQRPKRKPHLPVFDKDKPFTRALRFTTHEGNVVVLDEDTRLADVVLRMVKAREQGVSVLDFPPGVRLSACIPKLRRLGVHFETQRRKVASDPFCQRIAIYRFKPAA
jgi:hypothetical protein